MYLLMNKGINRNIVIREPDWKWIMKAVKAILAVIVLLSLGCLHEPEMVHEPKIDIAAFVSVWELFEKDYPLFVYKDINWMDVGDAYYSRAEEVETSEEMMMLAAEMMAELQDPALFIITPAEDTIWTYEREYQSNVDMSVLMENYLQPNGYAGNVGGFAWCDPDVLPYAYFDTIPAYGDSVLEYFDAFIEQCVLSEVPAVIIDVRMNPVGKRTGDGWYDQSVMGRFLDYSRAGAIYRYRLGPEYYQYGDLHPAIDVAGQFQHTGTVYVLAGGGCTQAAEDFAANMENFPNTVLIGENTAGSSSNTNRESFFTGVESDRWTVSIGYMTILTHDHQWVEGVGVEPDIVVEATEADFAAGVDPVMEYAMNLLDQY